MKALYKYIILASLLFPMVGKAQTYQHAIGLKVGSPFGISYKHCLDDSKALEFQATGWPYGPRGTFLYERLKPFDHSQFSWFYGGGAHVQLYTLTSIGAAEKFKLDSKKGLGLGIESIIGIEYKIRNAPFISDFTLKPNFEVTTFGQYAINYDPSITFRYILK